ncbi:unnamed protein product [Moneuplotes crassus]|uniref:C2H2-type domain-containing protein n=1 Tax=Euplotes crassus TaxID=5936 RepID=A0AAD1XLG2_EUPCR|nr:unnamed protein product [Moneuplotes crassus]
MKNTQPKLNCNEESKSEVSQNSIPHQNLKTIQLKKKLPDSEIGIITQAPSQQTQEPVQKIQVSVQQMQAPVHQVQVPSQQMKTSVSQSMTGRQISGLNQFCVPLNDQTQSLCNTRYSRQSAYEHPIYEQSYTEVPSYTIPLSSMAYNQWAQTQAKLPSDIGMIEAEIAGETVKSHPMIINYLHRFKNFLNNTPEAKFKLLNEKFFRRVPRDHGVFKTNRGKDLKCPVCMRTINNNAELEKHFNTKHKDLVQQGIEFSNGEWTASNKVANVVAMFCFTHSSATPHIAKVVRDKIKGKQYFMNESEEEEDESLFDKV